MKYVNAKDILPESLLSQIRQYYQGGYLYIPKENAHQAGQLTEYKLELNMRNQYIYLKHLEGQTCRELGNIYHLSGSSIRRILAKERIRHLKMKTLIEQLLPLWGIKNRQLSQIYPTAWEVNHNCVIKVYDDAVQLERNIRLSSILSECKIPVAQIIPTKAGEAYAAQENLFFLMTKKLPGSNISDLKDLEMTRKMGCAIARLHRAFLQCEKEIAFWDNGLLAEMRGWVFENLQQNEWQSISEPEYAKAVEALESCYDRLPKQLIHRDVHFGNFLFFEGDLSGYIDFDLSQRNIRIFDLGYFLSGLLAEETADAFTKNEWLSAVGAVLAGYESLQPLSKEEKAALPCVMECIEILFVAYFSGIKDTKHADDACWIFHFLQGCKRELSAAIHQKPL